MKQQISPSTLLIFMLTVFTYIRLFFSNENLSFDYQFYIEFITELASLSTTEFIERASSSFPYFPWADFGSFEIGFASLVYIFSQILEPNAVYSTIACISLYTKLEVMRKFKVPPLILIFMYIFFVSLFESNALRAGIALSFIMLALLIMKTNRNIKLAVPLLALSMTFHLSSIIIIILLLAGFISHRLNISNRKLFPALVLLLIFPANMIEFAKLFGGKIEEYLLLAEDFNLYTGASGLNIASVLGVLFLVVFITRRQHPLVLNDPTTRKLNNFGIFLSYGSSSLIFFGGILSIIGDRVWQMVFPIVLSAAYSQKKTINQTTIYSSLFSIKDKPHTRLAEKFLFISIWLSIFYYTVVNLFLRYPQTNFFEFITGTVELIPPTVR